MSIYFVKKISNMYEYIKRFLKYFTQCPIPQTVFRLSTVP